MTLHGNAEFDARGVRLEGALDYHVPAGQGLPHVARHLIKRIVNPRLLSCMAFYDVASNIWQALARGGGWRCARTRTRPGAGACGR